MIPEELKRHRQWVHWKTTVRGGKPTKLPVRPCGRPASSTDETTWSAFDELTDDARGLGFVFTASDPYVGIDLDGCRDPQTGKLDDWAREIVLRFNTYTEVSPSQTGVKMFGISDSVWKNKNKVDLPGGGHGEKRPGIEVYDFGRYFAVTGCHLNGLTEIRNVEDELVWLAKKFGMVPTFFGVDGSDVPADSPVMERASRYLAKMDPAISGSSGHIACFKAALAMVQGFDLSTDQAFQLLALEYNPRCEPPWTERELRHKVDSAHKKAGQRGYLRDARPDQWGGIFIRTGDPPILESEQDTGDPVKRTKLSDSVRKYVDQIKNGIDDLIETGIPELDYAIGGGLALGEMVIVAARPSHGKSAIALQMVHHATEHGLPAVMISEEMSALAIGKRALQYLCEIPQEHWKTQIDDVNERVVNHFAERADALIVESCSSVDRVVHEIERAVEESQIKIAVVDYVQLLGGKGSSGYERVTEASKALRRLANRCNIVLIVLAQLNRAIEQRKKFIPLSSDLKETGQLEQDADVIVFGVWPHRIDSNQPKSQYQIFVGKNRNRAINCPSFTITFEPNRQRLVEDSVSVVFRPHDEFLDYSSDFN